MTVLTLTESERAEGFLTKINNSARSYMMRELPRRVRGEWEGEAKKSVTLSKGSIQLILTHTCGGQVIGTSVFPGCYEKAALDRGRRLGRSLVRDIRAHKCCDVPHLKIVEPQLCPICGVTDSKYSEWEGTCNHARPKLKDGSKAPSKSKRVRARIGGRKGPAKVRRRVVEKSRCGVELP